MIKVNYLLLVILIWIQHSLWLGKNGIIEFFRIYSNTRLDRNINEIMKMRDRNNRLSLEIHNLVFKDNLIEEYARQDLGMIKSDEIFYRISCDD